MPDSSYQKPFTASCAGGLVLNKDVFTMQPGEALQLSNFEPDITDPGVEAEEVFKCYIRYYEKYHMPQEREQIHVHTQYQEKYNKLRVMSSTM